MYSLGPQWKQEGKRHTTVTGNMSRNYDEEFAVFAVSLQKSRVLQLLDLEGSILAKEHVHMIAKMVSENRSLERVCSCFSTILAHSPSMNARFNTHTPFAFRLFSMKPTLA